MTIEEQIAQLGAQIEELLPQHRAAWEAWAPVHEHAKELRRAFDYVTWQIEALQNAVITLRQPVEATKTDPAQYQSPLR